MNFINLPNKGEIVPDGCVDGNCNWCYNDQCNDQYSNE